MADYEKFVRENEWKYKGKELQAAFGRLEKSERGFLLTREEFIAEAGRSAEMYKGTLKAVYDTLNAVYDTLAELFERKKLSAYDVYKYARFSWCLDNPEAIIAYECDNGGYDGNISGWQVNNCSTKISEDTAKIKINREWGFEASQIKLIGTPYYDASDWQFIRFNCGNMMWLWASDNLFQVYDE